MHVPNLRNLCFSLRQKRVFLFFTRAELLTALLTVAIFDWRTKIVD